MKKVVILLLITLSLSICSNEFANATSLLQNKAANLNKDKVRTTKDVTKFSDAQSVIDNMKNEGWTYDGLSKNKDGSFTLYFSKNGKKSLNASNYIEIEAEGQIVIPDGTYVGYLGNITIENTYKNNKLVKKVVNGVEQEI